LKRHIFLKSPLTPLCQRGEFLPFVSDPERSLTRRVKGGKEGFSFGCLYNCGLTSKLKVKGKVKVEGDFEKLENDILKKKAKAQVKVEIKKKTSIESLGCLKKWGSSLAGLLPKILFENLKTKY